LMTSLTSLMAKSLWIAGPGSTGNCPKAKRPVTVLGLGSNCDGFTKKNEAIIQNGLKMDGA
jgi:hypothetical protein